MKNTIVLAAFFAAASTVSMASVQYEVLRCTPKGGSNAPLGAPTYSVRVVTEEAPPHKAEYTIHKIPAKPNEQQPSAAIAAPILYGDAFISTRNLGKSGYVHIYSNDDVALIDINLFQLRNTGINTSGPLTNYACKRMDQRSLEVEEEEIEKK